MNRKLLKRLPYHRVYNPETIVTNVAEKCGIDINHDFSRLVGSIHTGHEIVYKIEDESFTILIVFDIDRLNNKVFYYLIECDNYFLITSGTNSLHINDFESTFNLRI